MSTEYTEGRQPLVAANTRRIEAFVYDESNEAEMAGGAHPFPVTPREVQQVLESGDYRVIKNTKDHPNQPYVMIGETHGGRLLAIPFGPTATPGVWRPATAYDAPAKYLTKREKT